MIFTRPIPGTSAFTLVELLVVIAILGLLATLVLIQVDTARLRAYDTRRITDIREITKALSMFRIDHDRFPDVGEGDPGRLTRGGWETSVDGTTSMFLAALHPYMPQVPVDPVNSAVTPRTGGTVTTHLGDYYYAYARYTVASGSATLRCPSTQGNFAVIAVHDEALLGDYNQLIASCGDVARCQHAIDTNDTSHLTGYPSTDPPPCRIWNTEFSNAQKLDE